MTTVQFPCPSCGTSLRVMAPQTPGKRVKCPRCATVFATPAAEDLLPPRPTKPAPPPGEDGNGECEEAPPKTRKKPKAASGMGPLLVGGAAVLLIAVGVTLAVIFWPKIWPEPSVVPGPPPMPFMPPGGGPPGPGRLAGPGGFRPAFSGGDPRKFTGGRKVFQESGCVRCHTIDGGSGGEQVPGLPPDLSHVGADPAHTADWLARYIRNPSTFKPDARMPPFEGRIQPGDLRTLAEYLAGLK